MVVRLAKALEVLSLANAARDRRVLLVCTEGERWCGPRSESELEAPDADS
jgi:hypothetical protein